jgi:hypothetical protein
MIKIVTKIKFKCRKIIEKINGVKTWCFDNMKKIDKPLAREDTQMQKWKRRHYNWYPRKHKEL